MTAPAPNNVFRPRGMVRVRDGDTAVLTVQYPGLPPVEIAYRLRGIDCPERLEPGGREATVFTGNLLANARKLVVQTWGMSFDRVVADVWADDELVQDRIVAAGHAMLALTAPAPALPPDMLPKAWRLLGPAA